MWLPSCLLLCLLLFLLANQSSALNCFIGKEAVYDAEQSKYGPVPTLTPCGADAKCCQAIPKYTKGYIVYSCSSDCRWLGTSKSTMEDVMLSFKEPDSNKHFMGYFCHNADWYRCKYPDKNKAEVIRRGLDKEED